MGATSIFFNGRLISVPGPYSEVDASGLETVGLGATGIVAVLGTGEGGRPVSDITETKDFLRFSTPEKMQAAFRSGQLHEVASMLFAPANDPNILGGAVEVVAMKTNPATQSTGSLKAGVTPQIDLTSKDFGAFTSQVNVELQDGSTQGKALTIRFEDVTESVDNLGGDGIFTLQYNGGSYGYNTAVGSVNGAGDISVSATRSGIGLLTDITNPATNNAVEIAGANQTGAVASITTKSGSLMTLTGLTGMTANHVGRNITITGAASGANNGTFPIAVYLSATSVQITNAAGVANDANNGAISWTVSDAGTLVTIYGLVGGVPTKETLTHNGTNTVTGATVWDAGGVKAVVCNQLLVAGTMTVKNAPGGTTIFSVAAAQLSKGAYVCENCYVEKEALSLTLDAAGVHAVLIWGKDASGAVMAESVTTNGTTPVGTTATAWTQIDVVVASVVPIARTLTVTAVAAKTLATVQNLLRKVEAYFSTKQRTVSGTVMGFIFEYGTGDTNFAVSDLDILSNVNVKNPATGTFTADLYAIVAWINQNSQLVEAAVSVGATSVPDNTPAPVYLSGGVEGTALFADYQNALNLLKRINVSSVVDLSGDPAVAAALNAHCAYMCGIGRSERDGFVGLLNSGMTDVPSKSEAKAQVIALNSRHIRAVAQAVERYNTQGERTEFPPPFAAALLAGAQAGAPVGTSLTFKYLNTLGVRQHSSWNPTDDTEEMVRAGIVIVQNIDGVGRRVVRNITTHLSSSNLAYVEGSVNAAVNFAAYSFRTAMEVAVGQRGFAGTLSAARAVALGVLGKLVDENIITSYRALTMTLVLDVLEVSVEMAPIMPINFVPITFHLTNQAQAA